MKAASKGPRAGRSIRCTPESKTFAHVASLLVHNALGKDFPALVICFGIIGLALFAATKIAFTVRACVAPDDLSADVQNATAKGAVHRFLLDRILFSMLSRDAFVSLVHLDTGKGNPDNVSPIKNHHSGTKRKPPLVH